MWSYGLARHADAAIHIWPDDQKWISRRTHNDSSPLNKKLQDARVDHEKTLLQRQIEATDAAIDKLVYELYGLTEEEIAIVEGKL